METARMSNQKNNIEIFAIRVGMAFLETFGMVMLLCGLFEIQIF